MGQIISTNSEDASMRLVGIVQLPTVNTYQQQKNTKKHLMRGAEKRRARNIIAHKNCKTQSHVIRITRKLTIQRNRYI